MSTKPEQTTNQKNQKPSSFDPWFRRGSSADPTSVGRLIPCSPCSFPSSVKRDSDRVKTGLTGLKVRQVFMLRACLVTLGHCASISTHPKRYEVNNWFTLGAQKAISIISHKLFDSTGKESIQKSDVSDKSDHKPRGARAKRSHSPCLKMTDSSLGQGVKKQQTWSSLVLSEACC